MEKSNSDTVRPDPCDQSQITVDEKTDSGVILTFNSSQRCIQPLFMSRG